MPKGWISSTGDPRKYRNLQAAIEHLLDDRGGALRKSPRNGESRDPDKRREADRESRRKARSERAANGGMQASFNISLEAAAAIKYLGVQWGFDSTKETMEVAVQYLAAQTRRGLKRIELFDPEKDT